MPVSAPVSGVVRVLFRIVVIQSTRLIPVSHCFHFLYIMKHYHLFHTTAISIEAGGGALRCIDRQATSKRVLLL